MEASPAKGRHRVSFEFHGRPHSQVFVAGTFNDWNPEKKQLHCNNGDGVYRAVAMLPEGRHEYKFVVDGKWQLDPNCPDWVPNCLGTMNSVITV